MSTLNTSPVPLIRFASRRSISCHLHCPHCRLARTAQKSSVATCCRRVCEHRSTHHRPQPHEQRDPVGGRQPRNRPGGRTSGPVSGGRGCGTQTPGNAALLPCLFRLYRRRCEVSKALVFPSRLLHACLQSHCGAVGAEQRHPGLPGRPAAHRGRIGLHAGWV